MMITALRVRPLLFLIACLVVLLGAFFLTLRLLNTEVPRRTVVADGRPVGELLATQRIANTGDLQSIL
jgi:ABC-type transporter Mla subunit MlaD